MKTQYQLKKQIETSVVRKIAKGTPNHTQHDWIGFSQWIKLPNRIYIHLQFIHCIHHYISPQQQHNEKTKKNNNIYLYVGASQQDEQAYEGEGKAGGGKKLICNKKGC